MGKNIITICLMLLASIAQAQISPWQPEFDKFTELDKMQRPAEQDIILFTGSSSIRMWKDPQQDFDNPNILNRGFGGSQIQDLIDNFDRIVLKYNPAMIVIYSGDNDIAAGKSAEQVFGDFCVLYGMIRADLPHCKVIFIAIKPSLARWNIVLEMQKANNFINEYINGSKNAAFADIYSVMIGKDGKPKPEYFLADGLHMTDQGYDLWTAVLKRYLIK